MESKDAIPPKEIDFASLTADGLWSIFVSKLFYGGALAYGVLSRLPFQRVFGKNARKADETKKMLVWMVLPYVQSIMGQAFLSPIGLTEDKLQKEDSCDLVWI